MYKKIMFLLGVCLCIYPHLSHAFGEQECVALASYLEAAENLDEDQVREILEEARKYNSTAGNSLEDYQEVLNPSGNGVMCSIQIPCIDLMLPVYHGTEEEVLSKGVGHIYGSSLPVGGEGAHSLLAGHRGLPNAELFTRLGELEQGDLFEVHVCGEVLTYAVCEIRIIEPSDTAMLTPQQGKDLVSLITCTPYGINTHRLVVTGERKEKI